MSDDNNKIALILQERCQACGAHSSKWKRARASSSADAAASEHNKTA